MADINETTLAQAITAGITAAQPRKVSAGQYDPKTPWQPNKRDAKKLKYACYQNGYRIPVKRLTNKEIEGLNAIVRSGRYINRMVEVAVWDDGGTVQLDIRYSNKDKDQRFENKNHWRNFEELVMKIVEEQNLILSKQKRTDAAVEKMIAMNDIDDPETGKSLLLQDSTDPETRIEHSAMTPRQEATEKKKRQSFPKARQRQAEAEA